MARYRFIVFSFVFALAQPFTNVYAQNSDSDQANEELSEDEARAKAIKELEDLKRAGDEKKRQQAEAREQQQKQEQEKEGSKPKSPKKVFKPTEEISEDLPVPFPVDI